MKEKIGICKECGKETGDLFGVRVTKGRTDIYHIECLQKVINEETIESQISTSIDLFINDFRPVLKSFLTKHMSISNFGVIVSKLLQKHFMPEGIKVASAYINKGTLDDLFNKIIENAKNK